MKAMYRVLSLVPLSALLITFCLFWSAHAAANDLARVPAGEHLARFIDDKGLLTPAQAATLTTRLDEISKRHQFDTVVTVVASLGPREAKLYAANFFEQNKFGFGNSLDGAILLLATEKRDFAFACTGFGLKAFTPAGQEYLEELFLPHLRENRYFEAFMAYADAVDDFLVKAKVDNPYNEGNIPFTPQELIQYRMWSAVVSLAIAIIIACIVTAFWKFQLKSVRKQNLAHAYIREGSMAVTAKRDVFLYRHMSKTPRPKNKDKGNRGGGGTFSSSSGGSWSGRSGKY